VEASQHLRFGLADENGTVMPVMYEGVKPGNFEEATEIVAVGKYRDGAFHADQLLVKCPSKYQGLDEDPSTHGSEA
jgi:cytochrome c-type biogenesis protein CcmE